MTALDFLVLILVGGGAARGAFRGFTTEVLTLLSWVFGIVALRVFYAPVADWFADVMQPGALAAIAAFLLLFFGVVLLVRFLASRIGSGVRNSVVGPVDRVLGLGFGALKGLVAVTLIFLFVNLATDYVSGEGADPPHWIADAASFPLLNASSRAIVDFAQENGDAANSTPVEQDRSSSDPG